MAVYVKNRIPHRSLNMTPYEAFTGHKPDLSRMRIFGSRIRAKKPGRRPAKLDSHSDSGIFLGFGATPSNGYFIDDATGQVKLGTHLIFDEAHMSVPARKAPIAAESLQRLGYYNREQWIDDVIRDQHTADSNNRIAIQRRTESAIIPTRGTPDSIGLDLHSDEPDFILQPGETRTISTGISAAALPGTYLCIAPRSGLTVKKHLHTLAGVIDPDYTGDIGVVLHNFGTQAQAIKQRDRIAQLIAERASTPDVMETTKLHNTARGEKGFGSTDKVPRPNLDIPPIPINAAPSAAAAATAYFIKTCKTLDNITCTQSHDISTKIHNISTDMNLTFDMPFDIELSSSPFDTFTDRDIAIKGDHPTLGLHLEHNKFHNLPQLKHCQRSIPSAQLNSWRRDLRDGFLNRINDTNVHTIADIQKVIQ
jgi:dUTP pyrophosphatase